MKFGLAVFSLERFSPFLVFGSTRSKHHREPGPNHPKLYLTGLGPQISNGNGTYSITQGSCATATSLVTCTMPGSITVGRSLWKRHVFIHHHLRRRRLFTSGGNFTEDLVTNGAFDAGIGFYSGGLPARRSLQPGECWPICGCHHNGSHDFREFYRT